MKIAIHVRVMAWAVLPWYIFLSSITTGAAVASKSWSRWMQNLHAVRIDTPGDVTFEVTEEQLPVGTFSQKCLCKKDEFWHWRLKKCFPQGGWGYECGFFPAEHHHRVCLDGLVCKALPKPYYKEEDYIEHGAKQKKT